MHFTHTFSDDVLIEVEHSLKKCVKTSFFHFAPATLQPCNRWLFTALGRNLGQINPATTLQQPCNIEENLQ